MNLTKFEWTHQPKSFTIDNDKIEVVTEPHTDLWQRTYYHFQNDNAPVLLSVESPQRAAAGLKKSNSRGYLT